MHLKICKSGISGSSLVARKTITQLTGTACTPKAADTSEVATVATISTVTAIATD